MKILINYCDKEQKKQIIIKNILLHALQKPCVFAVNFITADYKLLGNLDVALTGLRMSEERLQKTIDLLYEDREKVKSTPKPILYQHDLHYEELSRQIKQDDFWINVLIFIALPIAFAVMLVYGG